MPRNADAAGKELLANLPTAEQDAILANAPFEQHTAHSHSVGRSSPGIGRNSRPRVCDKRRGT